MIGNLANSPSWLQRGAAVWVWKQRGLVVTLGLSNHWCDCHAVTQLRTTLRIQLKGKTRDHAMDLRRARLHTGSS